MTQPSHARKYVTPGAILVALAGFFAGAASMAFNPFFVISVVAVLLGIATLRDASRFDHYLVTGMLRIAGVLAIMGGAGGAMALAFPGLGVR